MKVAYINPREPKTDKVKELARHLSAKWEKKLAAEATATSAKQKQKKLD